MATVTQLDSKGFLWDPDVASAGNTLGKRHKNWDVCQRNTSKSDADADAMLWLESATSFSHNPIPHLVAKFSKRVTLPHCKMGNNQDDRHGGLPSVKRQLEAKGAFL